MTKGRRRSGKTLAPPWCGVIIVSGLFMEFAVINVDVPPFLARLAPGQRTPCHSRGDLFVGKRIDARTAKGLCRQCPVLAECADYAVRREEPYGVWGGMTPSERAVRRASVCGTEGAWRRHVQRQEGCLVCREAHQERLRAERLERLAAEHELRGGSLAGYRLERLLGLETCPRCRAVRQAYYASRPRTRKWYRRAAA